MNSVYENNKEIVTFLNKAQNKIADLSTKLVEVGGEDYDIINLLLELSDFIESLDSKYCDWKESEILSWIHEYNYRADLNSIPFIDITGFNTTVLLIEGSIGLPITTNDISDYIVATNTLIRSTPHNLLAELQGGLLNERYHITKQMYDYLDNLVNPKVPSTVNLTIQAPSMWPSGYYELGTNLSNINLIGSIIYNYYKQATYFEYKKNNLVIGNRVNNPRKSDQPNNYLDRSIVNTNTTYSFNAMFPDGLKTDSKSIIFRQPMYYGVIEGNNTDEATLLVQGTKDVRDRGEITLTFDIPVGNTLIQDNSYFIPYLFIPLEWGRFSTAFNSIFDFAGDWVSENKIMPLANGSSKEGLLLTYPTQIEGLITFKFNW